MAETFKRMESGHTEGDGWGIYAEYTSPICNMQCLMKTVLENSTPESLGNREGIRPTCGMGSNVIDHWFMGQNFFSTQISLTFRARAGAALWLPGLGYPSDC